MARCTVTTYLEHDTLLRVEQKAREDKTSVAAVLREAVEKQFPPPPPAAEVPGPSSGDGEVPA